jgi:hypothetical protein
LQWVVATGLVRGTRLKEQPARAAMVREQLGPWKASWYCGSLSPITLFLSSLATWIELMTVIFIIFWFKSRAYL